MDSSRIEQTEQAFESVVASPSPTFSCSSPETTPSLSTPTFDSIGTQQMVIVDWDDTLMPSTYFVTNIVFSTNRKKQIKAFRLSSKLDTEAKADEFKSNMAKAGQAAFDLLTLLIREFGRRNVKIVTNARKGWIMQSLSMLTYCSPIFQQIHALLRENQIELFYARDESLPSAQWKSKCIGNLLWREMSRRESPDDKLRVTTIGDQWWDHESVTDSFANRVYGDVITRHQIKLLNEPSCRYLVTELNYVHHVIENQLLNKSEDVTLEFDGYYEEKDEEYEQGYERY